MNNGTNNNLGQTNNTTNGTNGVVNNTQVNQGPVNPVVNNTGGPTPTVTPNINPTIGVNPTVISPNQVTDNNTDNGLGPQNLKSVEIDYKPPSKFKIFILILFFGGLVAFVLFLPEITSFIEQYKNKDTQETKITTGKLRCHLESATSNLTSVYDNTFMFVDNKVEKINYITVVKGSVSEDSETLNKLNEECNILKEHTKGMDGITIKCNYMDGELEKKQNFDLAKANFEALDPVFAEAGGTVIEYRQGDDIDKIEKNMNTAGYSCKREA